VVFEPQLKIFRSVVVANAILVVNGLTLSEFATERLLHHQAVL
jgi:hypothetical protein